MGDAVFRVPLVVTPHPREGTGEGGEEVVDDVGDDHVIVEADQPRHDHHGITKAWNKVEKSALVFQHIYM